MSWISICSETQLSHRHLAGWTIEANQHSPGNVAKSIKLQRVHKKNRQRNSLRDGLRHYKGVRHQKKISHQSHRINTQQTPKRGPSTHQIPNLKVLHQHSFTTRVQWSPIRQPLGRDFLNRQRVPLCRFEKEIIHDEVVPGNWHRQRSKKDLVHFQQSQSRILIATHVHRGRKCLDEYPCQVQTRVQVHRSI